MTSTAPTPGAAAPVQPADDVRGLDRSGLARCAAAIASLGAALVAVAVGAAQLRAGSALGAPVALLGLWQLGWALAALAADRPPLLPLAVGVPALGALGWVVGAAGETSRFLPAAVGVVLSAGAAVLVLRSARWAREDDPARTSRPRVQIAVLALAAAVVSGTTTPALAASPAGDGAVSHSEHLSNLKDLLPGADGVSPGHSH